MTGITGDHRGQNRPGRRYPRQRRRLDQRIIPTERPAMRRTGPRPTVARPDDRQSFTWSSTTKVNRLYRESASKPAKLVAGQLTSTGARALVPSTDDQTTTKDIAVSRSR